MEANYLLSFAVISILIQELAKHTQMSIEYSQL